jgi:hypothetical protein
MLEGYCGISPSNCEVVEREVVQIREHADEEVKHVRMRGQSLKAQRSQAFREGSKETSERVLIKDGEVQTGEGKRSDVVEGSEIARDRCEGLWRDPLELVLGEMHGTNMVTERLQASIEPRLEVGEGIQADFGVEVVMAPIDPSGRDEGTRKKAVKVPDEHIDYMLDDVLGEVRCDHLRAVVESDKVELETKGWGRCSMVGEVEEVEVVGGWAAIIPDHRSSTGLFANFAPSIQGFHLDFAELEFSEVCYHPHTFQLERHSLYTQA